MNEEERDIVEFEDEDGNTLLLEVLDTFYYNGEEFAVLLPNTPLPGALHVAEQTRASIEAAVIPGINDAPSLKVTASIGAASITPSIDSLVADLIGQADKALYAAKEMGRNRVCS